MIKKLTAAALTVLTAAALAGCQGKETMAVMPVTGTESASEAVSGTGRPDGGSEKDGVPRTTMAKETSDLSQEQLAVFTELFNSASYNGFLLSEYERPQEIDLGETFYNGAGIETEGLSGEEIEALVKAGAYFDTDCTKLTTAQIEAALLKRLGYGMADMVHPLGWTYLPQFDTYYLIHGDTNFRILKCLEGTEEPDGSMVIRYEPDSTFYGTQGDLWQVKLEPSGEEWKILSNVCLERTVNLYHPDATVENFVRTEARLSGTPQSMVDALIELGALPEGTRVNSFTKDGSGGAVLDMNQVFGQALNRTGTTGERSLLGSLANTFIQRYGLMNLTITIDGEVLETGHGIFDTPFEFFTFI